MDVTITDRCHPTSVCSCNLINVQPPNLRPFLFNIQHTMRQQAAAAAATAPVARSHIGIPARASLLTTSTTLPQFSACQIIDYGGRNEGAMPLPAILPPSIRTHCLSSCGPWTAKGCCVCLFGIISSFVRIGADLPRQPRKYSAGD